MMYEKCTLGYLTKRKKAEILWIVFFVVLGVAIFLTGYLWSGVRANIFTVMAVLLVLPAAKHLVALIAMFCKKGVTKERYDKVKTAAGQAVLYTDYVFTSTEKIMHLDFLLVKNGNALAELGKEKENLVVLDADLAAATKTGIFKKAFPERHIDCGIAEANMTGIAAGLSTCGKVPFVSTFAMFAAGRAYEQVRNSIGYPHLNVKIGATHAGISVGEDGATHQCNEDIGLMREIPGIVIINPSDDVEARAAVRAAYEYVGPVYLRFGRLAVPVINDNPEYKFEIGKGVELRKGKDITIFATGLCVSETLKAAETLAADGIDAQVINIHTIKPLDEELVLKAAKQTGRVYTVEEHSIIGGLGSAVAELLGEKCPTKITRIGVKDVFGESGPAKELLHKYELDAEGIAKRIMEEQKSC